MRRNLPTIICAILLVGAAMLGAGEPLLFTGVNLAGGEFCDPKPGGPAMVPGRNFIYSGAKEADYFSAKGMNIVRVPFKWENLQPVPGQELVPAQVDALRKSVAMITARRMVVLIDPHNYARYYGKLIGETAEVPIAHFADFWGRLAVVFANDPLVWFGLVNEPHDYKSTAVWLSAANAAIAAIRAAKASNLILVPGNGWTSAGGWVDGGKPNANGTVMTGVKDPLDHFAYEVHQYLDSDNSGSHKEVVSATIGVERLKTFTAWCRSQKRRAFLGEFAAGLPDSDAGKALSRTAIQNMLTFMEANRDVWLGWTWWAAGPWWGDYIYTIEPKNGVDRPQMEWLTPFLNKSRTPAPSLPIPLR